VSRDDRHPEGAPRSKVCPRADDYKNAPTTTHADILSMPQTPESRIAQELANQATDGTACGGKTRTRIVR